jgi:nitrate reductase alpha subunit
VVRSTHGVNCTGSCSWKIHVKDGLVTWETQQTDYPSNGPGVPDYEPRGCPRGASFSWYVYSPVRPKYPYVRGVLLAMFREELERTRPFDRTFLNMMIPHHLGAIRMARVELAKGRQGGLRKMAKDIIAAQTREIGQMRRWGKRWYGSDGGSAQGSGHGSRNGDGSMMGGSG